MRILGPTGFQQFSLRHRIVDQAMYPGAEGQNICQPFLMPIPPGFPFAVPGTTYALYWANHNGGDVTTPPPVQRIKVVTTNAPSLRQSIGTWTPVPAGSLTLAAIEAFGPYPHDAVSAHIGSPWILYDSGTNLFRMWVHAQCGLPYGHATSYAESADGVNFTVISANPGGSDGIYLCIFEYNGVFYAVEESGILNRTLDPTGITGYIRQADPEIFRATLLANLDNPLGSVRHLGGMQIINDNLQVFYSCRADLPERIFYAQCLLTNPDWETWACGPPIEIARPVYDREGAFYQRTPSSGGAIAVFVNQFRDPNPVRDPADGSVWSVNAEAGEGGIDLFEITGQVA